MHWFDAPLRFLCNVVRHQTGGTLGALRLLLRSVLNISAVLFFQNLRRAICPCAMISYHNIIEQVPYRLMVGTTHKFTPKFLLQLRIVFSSSIFCSKLGVECYKIY
jgi:hypothetical protein